MEMTISEPNPKPPPRAEAILAAISARYRPGQVVTLAMAIEACG
jgi:hypothetical protein